MVNIHATDEAHESLRAEEASSYVKAQTKTLAAIYDSLFAPHFRALETYGEPPPPRPTEADVIAAMIETIVFHEKRAEECAQEILERASASPTNLALLARAVEHRKHHIAEIARIKNELEKVSA